MFSSPPRGRSATRRASSMQDEMHEERKFGDISWPSLQHLARRDTIEDNEGGDHAHLHCNDG